MHSWVRELVQLAEKNSPAVLLTVASVRGSAPREVGAKMIVTATESIGTIGGGQLEFQCVQLACDQLRAADLQDGSVRTRRFALGANCGQCCGGVVEVLFETLLDSNSDWVRFLAVLHAQRQSFVVATTLAEPAHKFIVSSHDRPDFPAENFCSNEVVAVTHTMLELREPARVVGGYLLEPVHDCEFQVAVFGAGHVGAATVDVISRLNCHVRWVDNRRNMFPQSVPHNVTLVERADPVGEIAALPAEAFFLVMTHSHALDQEICQRVLERQDFAYCGLIGSLAKRRRFTRRMREQGLAGSLLERLVCPIGVDGIEGKKPVEIAISVCAEILQVRDARASSAAVAPMCKEVKV